MAKYQTSLSRATTGLLSFLTSSESALPSRIVWLQRGCLVLIYLVCMASWATFVRFGRVDFGVQDWIWEWRYARILQEALRAGMLPLYTTAPASYQVSRFLALPDVPLPPQILLLRFFDIGTSFLVNLLIMVTVGYIGCLVIRRHFRLSLLSFTVMTLLFMFNGFIGAHIGIGHTLFSGYFYTPLFVFLLLLLTEDQVDPNWFLWAALLLFGIELQGTTQLFAIYLIALAVLLVLWAGRRLALLKAILAGVVVNLYRIIPAAIGLSAYGNRPQPGYLSATDLLAALTWLIPPSRSPKAVTGLPVGWWELDVYVGLIGLGFLTFFGLWCAYSRDAARKAAYWSPPLALTSLIFLALSIGYLYWPINSLPIPLVNLVHVPSRFVILPLSVAIAIAGISFQRWLDEVGEKPWLLAAVLVLAGVLAHDLLQHARLWRVDHIMEAFGPAALDYTLSIVSHPDPIYEASLVISWSISVAALLGLVLILVRGRARPPRVDAG